MRTTGKIADFTAVPWLDELAELCTHLSLCTTDPFAVVDPRTTEPVGGVFARVPVTWARSGRLLRNTNPLAWTGLATGTTVTFISGWDAAFNGNMLFATPIDPLTYDDQVAGGLVIDPEDLFLGFDL